MVRFLQNYNIFRRNILAVIGVCLSVYFCYHLVAGQRGYFRLLSLNHQVSTVNEDYKVLYAEREAVEKRVVMMRPGSIDRDLLEERARHVLGYRHKDELILLQNRS
jgi:cell division protein FtsB